MFLLAIPSMFPLAHCNSGTSSVVFKITIFRGSTKEVVSPVVQSILTIQKKTSHVLQQSHNSQPNGKQSSGTTGDETVLESHFCHIIPWDGECIFKNIWSSHFWLNRQWLPAGSCWFLCWCHCVFLQHHRSFRNMCLAKQVSFAWVFILIWSTFLFEIWKENTRQ